MKWTFLALVSAAVLTAGVLYVHNRKSPSVSAPFPYPLKQRIFSIEAIDTMKYSRDEARSGLSDTQIRQQVALVAASGATHIAVDTPYDAEFLPVLKEWVAAARAQHLSVWFRGNFSGWEGWFSYPRIDRTTHEQDLASFISNNPNLFQNGDILTPCPECENGGPGDPRLTGDAAGYDQFLIEEKRIADAEFKKQGKDIAIYTSMNGDIARQIITPAVAQALGGIVLIDHYVPTVAQFSRDLTSIPKELHAQVGLGEFGAPIPDLNGAMTPQQQASFVGGLLQVLYLHATTSPVVDYWTLKGGSTALIDQSGAPRPAYEMVKDFYSAPYIYGQVHDALGKPLMATVSVASSTFSTTTDAQGFYQVFLPAPLMTVSVSVSGYEPAFFTLSGTSTREDFSLMPLHPDLWYRVRLQFQKFF